MAPSSLPSTTGEIKGTILIKLTWDAIVPSLFSTFKTLSVNQPFPGIGYVPDGSGLNVALNNAANWVSTNKGPDSKLTSLFVSLSWYFNIG